MLSSIHSGSINLLVYFDVFSIKCFMSKYESADMNGGQDAKTYTTKWVSMCTQDEAIFVLGISINIFVLSACLCEEMNVASVQKYIAYIMDNILWNLECSCQRPRCQHTFCIVNLIQRHTNGYLLTCHNTFKAFTLSPMFPLFHSHKHIIIL